MDFIVKLLFLSGKYITQAAGRTIIEIINRSLVISKNISVKYERAVQVVKPYDNMLELLNTHVNDMGGNEEVQFAYVADDIAKDLDRLKAAPKTSSIPDEFSTQDNFITDNDSPIINLPFSNIEKLLYGETNNWKYMDLIEARNSLFDTKERIYELFLNNYDIMKNEQENYSVLRESESKPKEIDNKLTLYDKHKSQIPNYFDETIFNLDNRPFSLDHVLPIQIKYQEETKDDADNSTDVQEGSEGNVKSFSLSSNKCERANNEKLYPCPSFSVYNNMNQLVPVDSYYNNLSRIKNAQITPRKTTNEKSNLDTSLFSNEKIIAKLKKEIDSRQDILSKNNEHFKVFEKRLHEKLSKTKFNAPVHTSSSKLVQDGTHFNKSESNLNRKLKQKIDRLDSKRKLSSITADYKDRFTDIVRNHLDRETKYVKVNQRAFHKLERKVTQILIEQGFHDDKLIRDVKHINNTKYRDEAIKSGLSETDEEDRIERRKLLEINQKAFNNFEKDINKIVLFDGHKMPSTLMTCRTKKDTFKDDVINSFKYSLNATAFTDSIKDKISSVLNKRQTQTKPFSDKYRTKKDLSLSKIFKREVQDIRKRLLKYSNGSSWLKMQGLKIEKDKQERTDLPETNAKAFKEFEANTTKSLVAINKSKFAITTNSLKKPRQPKSSTIAEILQELLDMPMSQQQKIFSDTKEANYKIAQKEVKQRECNDCTSWHKSSINTKHNFGIGKHCYHFKSNEIMDCSNDLGSNSMNDNNAKGNTINSSGDNNSNDNKNFDVIVICANVTKSTKREEVTKDDNVNNNLNTSIINVPITKDENNKTKISKSNEIEGKEIKELLNKFKIQLPAKDVKCELKEQEEIAKCIAMEIDNSKLPTQNELQFVQPKLNEYLKENITNDDQLKSTTACFSKEKTTCYKEDKGSIENSAVNNIPDIEIKPASPTLVQSSDANPEVVHKKTIPKKSMKTEKVPENKEPTNAVINSKTTVLRKKFAFKPLNQSKGYDNIEQEDKKGWKKYQCTEPVIKSDDLNISKDETQILKNVPVNERRFELKKDLQKKPGPLNDIKTQPLDDEGKVKQQELNKTQNMATAKIVSNKFAIQELNKTTEKMISKLAFKELNKKQNKTAETGEDVSSKFGFDINDNISKGEDDVYESNHFAVVQESPCDNNMSINCTSDLDASPSFSKIESDECVGRNRNKTMNDDEDRELSNVNYVVSKKIKNEKYEESNDDLYYAKAEKINYKKENKDNSEQRDLQDKFNETFRAAQNFPTHEEHDEQNTPDESDGVQRKIRWTSPELKYDYKDFGKLNLSEDAKNDFSVRDVAKIIKFALTEGIKAQFNKAKPNEDIETVANHKEKKPEENVVDDTKKYSSNNVQKESNDGKEILRTNVDRKHATTSNHNLSTDEAQHANAFNDSSTKYVKNNPSQLDEEIDSSKSQEEIQYGNISNEPRNDFRPKQPANTNTPKPNLYYVYTPTKVSNLQTEQEEVQCDNISNQSSKKPVKNNPSQSQEVGVRNSLKTKQLTNTNAPKPNLFVQTPSKATNLQKEPQEEVQCGNISNQSSKKYIKNNPSQSEEVAVRNKFKTKQLINNNTPKPNLYVNTPSKASNLQKEPQEQVQCGNTSNQSSKKYVKNNPSQSEEVGVRNNFRPKQLTNSNTPKPSLHVYTSSKASNLQKEPQEEVQCTNISNQPSKKNVKNNPSQSEEVEVRNKFKTKQLTNSNTPKPSLYLYTPNKAGNLQKEPQEEVQCGNNSNQFSKKYVKNNSLQPEELRSKQQTHNNTLQHDFSVPPPTRVTNLQTEPQEEAQCGNISNEPLKKYVKNNPTKTEAGIKHTGPTSKHSTPNQVTNLQREPQTDVQCGNISNELSKKYVKHNPSQLEEEIEHTGQSNNFKTKQQTNSNTLKPDLYASAPNRESQQEVKCDNISSEPSKNVASQSEEVLKANSCLSTLTGMANLQTESQEKAQTDNISNEPSNKYVKNSPTQLEDGTEHTGHESKQITANIEIESQEVAQCPIPNDISKKYVKQSEEEIEATRCHNIFTSKQQTDSNTLNTVTEQLEDNISTKPVNTQPTSLKHFDAHSKTKSYDETINEIDSSICTREKSFVLSRRALNAHKVSIEAQEDNITTDDHQRSKNENLTKQHSASYLRNKYAAFNRRPSTAPEITKFITQRNDQRQAGQDQTDEVSTKTDIKKKSYSVETANSTNKSAVDNLRGETKMGTISHENENDQVSLGNISSKYPKMKCNVIPPIAVANKEKLFRYYQDNKSSINNKTNLISSDTTDTNNLSIKAKMQSEDTEENTGTFVIKRKRHKEMNKSYKRSVSYEVKPKDRLWEAERKMKSIINKNKLVQLPVVAASTVTNTDDNKKEEKEVVVNESIYTRFPFLSKYRPTTDEQDEQPKINVLNQEMVENIKSQVRNTSDENKNKNKRAPEQQCSTNNTDLQINIKPIKYNVKQIKSDIEKLDPNSIYRKFPFLMKTKNSNPEAQESSKWNETEKPVTVRSSCSKVNDSIFNRFPFLKKESKRTYADHVIETSPAEENVKEEEGKTAEYLPSGTNIRNTRCSGLKQCYTPHVNQTVMMQRSVTQQPLNLNSEIYEDKKMNSSRKYRLATKEVCTSLGKLVQVSYLVDDDS